MTKDGNYHHGDLRAALLREALRDLETTPAHELSVRDIAHRIGVSKAAPYRHFPTRPDFLAALCQEGFERFLAELRSVPDHPESPLSHLRALGGAYVRFAAANPWLYRLLFSAEGHRLASPQTMEVGQRCFSVLVEASQRAHALGWRPGQDPVWLASALWAHVHGISMLRLEGILAAPPGQDESHWERLAGALLDS